jgi:hypothetical protein
MVIEKGKWVGVDFDGTLAEYHGWNEGKLGSPIPEMVERVKCWLSDGVDVRIFTGRISPIGIPSHLARGLEQQRQAIWEWCQEHIGQALPVTYCKDGAMAEYWDDAAVQVGHNTGIPIDLSRR